MRKLVQGIVDFRNRVRPKARETFAQLALGQSPDALFIACSDSRVAINVFASTEPGDLFVVRNVGNIVSPAAPDGLSVGDESEAAAIEFAVGNLKVRDIIVCGHSSCGAMTALVRGRENVRAPHLKSWLRHAERALERVADPSGPGAVDQLSQQNALLQLEHLRTYPIVDDALKRNALKLHAFWFDIANAEVLAHDPALGKFVPLDEQQAARLERLGEQT
ncbi:MAG TPA: carbonic anhydrase [Myxococcales bacterium]|nr:carbonic anhydrase [Myxococcales bacterium]